MCLSSWVVVENLIPRKDVTGPRNDGLMVELRLDSNTCSTLGLAKKKINSFKYKLRYNRVSPRMRTPLNRHWELGHSVRLISTKIGSTILSQCHGMLLRL